MSQVIESVEDLNTSETCFELREVSEEEIKSFCNKELLFHETQGTLDGNEQYLSYFEEAFMLTTLAAIYDKQEMVAFCVIPKYMPESVMRLYVSPKYRKMGLGSFLLNFYRIVKLSCMKNNDIALSLYEKLGFKIDLTRTHVYEMTREPSYLSKALVKS